MTLLKILTETIEEITKTPFTEEAENSIAYFWEIFIPFAVIAIVIAIFTAKKKRK